MALPILAAAGGGIGLMWWVLYSKIKANGGRRRKRDENKFGFFQQIPSYLEEFIFGNTSNS